MGFAVDGKGYIMGGDDGSFDGGPNDLLQYDPLADTWKKKKNFPGLPRESGVSFALEGKGYVCIGSHYSGGGPQYQNDLWMYDPQTNNWSEKAALPAQGRYLAVGFVIEGKAYVTTGFKW